jgi:hypothetical protein
MSLQMKRVVFWFLVMSLVASVGLFWLKAPKTGPARKILVFAKAMSIAAWLVALSAIIYFIFFFSLLGPSKDEILFEKMSPDKFCTVAAFNRNGNATVENTTLISIRLSSEKLDTENNPIVFREVYGRKVSAIWESNKHLVIRYDNREVYDQVTNWQDVTITYIME